MNILVQIKFIQMIVGSKQIKIDQQQRPCLIWAAAVPQSPSCWNTWLFKGAPLRTLRSRGRAWSFLRLSPGATVPFVPRSAAPLRFLAPIPSFVREYPNYTGSTEWSWPQVRVNACICVRVLSIGVLNWGCSRTTADWSWIVHLYHC